MSASSSWAAVEALAALLEPEAFNPDQPADETWRYVTQQRALGHAETVIMSDWRRVVEDDDTIERLARSVSEQAIDAHDGPIDGLTWDEDTEESREQFRWVVRAVVRALREGQA